MSLKAKIEAIIYAAEEPITADQIAEVLKAELAEAPAAEQQALPTNDQQGSVDTEAAPEAAATDAKKQRAAARARVKAIVEELTADYANSERAMEIRQIAGGYRMSTKPEHHDVVKAFAKNLKAPMRLSLQSLETLAVIAYKQPVTVPEINEIRGVDSSGVIGSLIARKLITTAGRKQVIGRPILYKTTKDFLLRFGLKDISELPSIEEFEKLSAAQELFDNAPVADATGVPDVPEHEAAQSSDIPEDHASAAEAEDAEHASPE